MLKEIENQSLCSVMNDTKWKKLVEGVRNLPFPPPFQLKGVISEPYPDSFGEEVNYLVDWSEEVMHDFYLIQWILVKPSYRKHCGHLIADEIIDETEEFVELLHNCKLDYDVVEGMYKIYGYR